MRSSIRWLPLLGKFVYELYLFSTTDVADNYDYSILCSDLAIKKIDEPFVTKDDNPEEWEL